jgi:hypothetical protein
LDLQQSDGDLYRYINLKLAALGQPISARTAEAAFLHLTGPLLRNYHQKDLLLADKLCPVDARIQAFLDSYLGIWESTRLPASTFILDRPGIARAMSLPAGEDYLASPYLKSYRVAQGVLHNPKSDRRTTKGIFHIVAGSHRTTSCHSRSRRISPTRFGSSFHRCYVPSFVRPPAPTPRNAWKRDSSCRPVW